MPPTPIDREPSTVVHRETGQTIRYGLLAADAERLAAPARPRLKSNKDYALIGRSLPRPDIPAKVTGALQFEIDVDLPEMRYAAIRSAPVHGGRLLHVDPQPALPVQGVERVVCLVDSVAVIAASYWQARKASKDCRRVFPTAATAQCRRTNCSSASRAP